MPKKQSRTRSGRVKRRMNASSSSSSRGYSSRATARVSGRECLYSISSDGSTSAAFANLGNTSTFSTIALQPNTFSNRVAAIAANFAEWQLHSITVEFVQRSSTSATFSIGVVDDPDLNIVPNFSRVSALESSRVFNLGSGLKQSFSFRPRQRWLFTSNQGQSTGASIRQVSAGELYGLWDATGITGPAVYGHVFLHYDLSFRSACENLTVNIHIPTMDEEADLPERTGKSTEQAVSLKADFKSAPAIAGDLAIPPLTRQRVQFVQPTTAAAVAAALAACSVSAPRPTGRLAP